MRIMDVADVTRRDVEECEYFWKVPRQYRELERFQEEITLGDDLRG